MADNKAQNVKNLQKKLLLEFVCLFFLPQLIWSNPLYVYFKVIILLKIVNVI